MAQRVRVMLICDLHDDDTSGDETVPFSLDGVSYEMDVCRDHARDFRETLAPYLGVSRRVGGGRARRAARGSRARASAGGDRSQTAAVRAWAREQGLPVSERGRIPASLVAQYEAARGR
jgi:hypothetical protein